jgi:GMC oxidoreductase
MMSFCCKRHERCLLVLCTSLLSCALADVAGVPLYSTCFCRPGAPYHCVPSCSMNVADIVSHALLDVQMLRAALLCAVAALPVALGADYVIVGGGTAGCTLAARLCAALPNAQITLLERGAPRTPAQDLLVSEPKNAFYAWNDPGITETIRSAPNSGLIGRTVSVLIGNTLGGTSAINGAQWTRPEAAVPASWGVKGPDTNARKRALLQGGTAAQGCKAAAVAAADVHHGLARGGSGRRPAGRRRPLPRRAQA